MHDNIDKESVDRNINNYFDKISPDFSNTGLSNNDGIGGVNASIYQFLKDTKKKYKKKKGDDIKSIFTPLSIIQRCFEGIYIINTLNYMGKLMKEYYYNKINEIINNNQDQTIKFLLDEIYKLLADENEEDFNPPSKGSSNETEKKEEQLKFRFYYNYLPIKLEKSASPEEKKTKFSKWNMGKEALKPFRGIIMKTGNDILDEKFGVYLKENNFLIDFIGMLYLGDIITKGPDGKELTKNFLDQTISDDRFKNNGKNRKISRYDMNVIRPFRYGEKEYKENVKDVITPGTIDKTKHPLKNIIVNLTLDSLFQTGTESFKEILKASD